MKVYVAGKYSGNILQRVRNILRARWYATKLVKMGLFAYTPHLNTMFFDRYGTWSFFLAYHMGFLDVCDAILMLPGWQQSPGAREEHTRARELKMPIAYNLKDMMEIALRKSNEAA